MQKQNLKIILILIILILPSFVLAAPSIIEIEGTLGEGNQVLINGNGFGFHSLNVESLHQNIESGNVGEEFNKVNWTRSDWDAWADPIYNNEEAHSGNKSIKCSVNNSDYNCAFAYDMPNVQAGESLYVTWWVKYIGETDGQWKMFRISEPLTIIDGEGEAVASTWFDLQRYIIINPGTATDRTLWLGEEQVPRGDGSWHRIELEYFAGDTNTPNGIIAIRTTSSAGIIGTNNFSDVNTHINTGDSWNYAIWQNYLGNGISSGEIWMDDIYLQYNTFARVEVCSGSNWNLRGGCDIQVASYWDNELINIYFNQGSFFEGETAYLYVVDSTGAVNVEGHPIVIGSGGSGDATPPDVPQGLVIF